MKKAYYFFFALSFSASFSQVGIGTSSPQQELHVAGTNSTIRIEGLDAINDPLNDGPGNLTPVYVTNQGNLTLTAPSYISGGTGYALPINFLMDTPDFVPNNIMGLPAPYTNHGRVINSDTSNESVSQLIHTVTINVPAASMIEFKYGMSVMYSSTDLSNPPYTANYIDDEKSRNYQIFFCIDIDSDGLSMTEYNRQYGRKGQYYGSTKGGVRAFTYMNSQGYATLPEGTHTVYFYGEVNDPINTYTSLGFGGANDYLRIRVY